MVTCAVCNKKRSELDMRPLVNVDELDLANELSEAGDKEGVEATREVAGAELQVVCRRCWVDILSGMEKDDIIEQLETLCGLLFELERRKVEEAATRTVIIEKERDPLLPIPTGPPMVPIGPLAPMPTLPRPGTPWASPPYRDSTYPRWQHTQILCKSGGVGSGGQQTSNTSGQDAFSGSVAFDAGRTMGTAQWSGMLDQSAPGDGGNHDDHDDDDLGAPVRAVS